MINLNHLNHDLRDIESAASRIRANIADAQPKPLTEAQWNLLARCERALYHTDPSAQGWTDVMSNDGDVLLNALWEQAYMAAENTVEDDNVAATEREVARRVAAALAVLSFGKEFLLK